MISLKGKNILITGASSGIGEATAILCDSLGANVILSGRNKENLNAVAKKLKNKTLVLAADLTNPSEINSLAAD